MNNLKHKIYIPITGPSYKFQGGVVEHTHFIIEAPTYGRVLFTENVAMEAEPQVTGTIQHCLVEYGLA